MISQYNVPNPGPGPGPGPGFVVKDLEVSGLILSEYNQYQGDRVQYNCMSALKYICTVLSKK